ncbi:phage portal protein [Maricurvus nonylphenolicus]|uniref:phage portal protein n=1 Tax=Maricurvus nonylphenolicus TaxID=1008307 RepID=UPI0036F31AF3
MGNRRNQKRANRNNHSSETVEHATQQSDTAMAFSFGDPESVLDSSQILDYAECWEHDDYYEPPISFDGLAKSFRAAPHHSSAIYLKRNILASTFVPHKRLSKQEFSAYALDYLVFGNAFLEEIPSKLGGTVKFKRSPAKYTRRMREADRYCFLRGWQDKHEFDKGAVFHLVEPDINQEIYGLPEYLASLNSAWLNESATLFRRKYYKNGSHAGFILYMTDAAQETQDVDNLRQALKDSKGPGNFKNLFMYAPNGKKEGLQVIPISEVQAKDEFFNIKNVTRNDQLAAHRVWAGLIGVIPENSGGFGNPKDAAAVFTRNEIQPLQERLTEFNDWAGEKIIEFKPYEIELPDGKDTK